MLENLQYLFREQLPADDVKVLRSFLNEHPGVFIIIGTALTVFGELTDYGKPFYHFFRVRSMGNMEREEIIDFLLKLAAFRKDKGIEERIETNRRYIYLYQLLTGGNPRLVLFLYELLLGNEILDTYMILGKIAELTPYFLDKTRDESGQRKLILDALATEAPAQTAREIAEYVNEDYKSIGEQLKRLSAEGWIREISIDADDVKKNEVFYTLRDYFYRLWYRTRTKGIEESDILCMAELAVFLFDRQGIEDRLKKYTGSNEETRALYEKSLELAADEVFMRNINVLLKEVERYENEEINKLILEITSFQFSENWEKMINTAKKMLHYPKFKNIGYYNLGDGYLELGNYNLALEYYQKALKIKPDENYSWLKMGICYYHLAQYDKSYSAISKSIKYSFISFSPTHLLSKLPLFLRIEILKKIAYEIFDSFVELQHLLDKNSTLKRKFESLCRLLLLGKFSTLTDVIDKLLEEDNLALDEAKKLEFLLEAEILYILRSRLQDSALKIYLKYWVRLVGKRYNEQTARKIFLQFIYVHITITGKEKVSLETVESICHQLYEEGIEISDIILKIIAAVKNPHTREAQQWMADPLFSEVVKLILGNN
jgi:tetratricopeptide (TPR) repeat protein